MPRPRKVNTRLKALAESRARATASIERLNGSLTKLFPKIDEARVALVELEEAKLKIEHRLMQAHNLVRETDKALRNEFPNVSPADIPSTYGFRSEYRKRGTLLDTIREVVGEAGEEGISLNEIALEITKRLNLQHNTHADFRAWVSNSLESALDTLRFKKMELDKYKPQGKHPRWFVVKRCASWEDLANLEHETGSEDSGL